MVIAAATATASSTPYAGMAIALSFVLLPLAILIHLALAAPVEHAGEEKRLPRHPRQPERAVQEAPTLKPTPDNTYVQVMEEATSETECNG